MTQRPVLFHPSINVIKKIMATAIPRSIAVPWRIWVGKPYRRPHLIRRYNMSIDITSKFRVLKTLVGHCIGWISLTRIRLTQDFLSYLINIKLSLMIVWNVSRLDIYTVLDQSKVCLSNLETRHSSCWCRRELHRLADHCSMKIM